MVDDKRDERFGVADEMRALADVRSALESVEREQNRVLEDRRGLRARLEGLLEALREDALVLRFDAEGELVDASGPVEAQVGVSAAELVSSFEDFADEETVDALDEANRAVLDEGSTGASVSDGFLRTADEDLAVTWIHVRRWDEGGELTGTEVIGLVAPLGDADEGLGGAGDPFEDLLEHLSRRLVDDVGEASITGAVQTFGDFLSADRVVINRYDEDTREFSVISSWLRGDTRPLEAEVRGLSISELPWAYSALSAGEAVVVSPAADLPAEAVAERELYAGDDATASLLVPMVRDDRLTGFISIQSTHQERDWSASDISRAQKFAMALSAALARAEAEEALAEARSELDEANEQSAAAEVRVQQAEASGSEAQQKLDELTADADAVRSRVTEVETELEGAKKSESEAREAADDARSELDNARQETEEARTERDALKDEAEGARSELEVLKESADRVQRRSEDAAADALGVRKELEDARAQLKEARREAADARAELQRLREVGGTSTDDEVHASAPELAAVEIKPSDPDTVANDLPELVEPGGYDPDATLKMSGERLELETFDPDATIEMEPRPSETEETSEGEASPEAATEQEAEAETEEEENEAEEIGGPEATEAVKLRSRLEEPDSEEFPRAVSLDEMLERTPAGVTRERGSTRGEAAKAAWEDSTEEVAPSEFLETDDEEAEGAEEADAEVAGADADERALAVDDAEAVEEVADGSVTLDVEAARRLARQVAGKGEDDEAAVPEAPAEEPAEQVPNLAGIDSVVGLRHVGDNVELYRNLLTKFRNDYMSAGAKIDSAIEKGNIEVAHLLLHAVKGVAGNLGVTAVRDAADELETQLIGDDSADTGKAVEEFMAALNGALDSIATLDNDTVSAAPLTPAPTKPPPEVHVSDPMVLRSYLSGLRQHLLDEKLPQCQLVMREISARNWPGDYNERVARLAGFIEEERFKEARATFEELMDQFVKA